MEPALRARFWVRALTIFATALVLAAVGYVLLFPVYADHNWQEPKVSHCVSNLKQLVFALIIYAADNDDRMPNRDQWMDQALEYGKLKVQVAQCPELQKEKLDPNKYGYALNSSLSSANLNHIDNAVNVPMIYDSINLARNASDSLLSLPLPGRHRGSENRLNVIGFVDGHVSIRPDSERYQ